MSSYIPVQYDFDVRFYEYSLDGNRKYKNVFTSEEFGRWFKQTLSFPSTITTKTNVKPLICAITNNPNVDKCVVTLLAGNDLLELQEPACTKSFTLQDMFHFPFAHMKIVTRAKGTKTKAQFQFVMEFYDNNSLVHRLEFGNPWQITSKSQNNNNNNTSKKRRNEPVKEGELDLAVVSTEFQSTPATAQIYPSKLAKFLSDMRDEFSHAVYENFTITVDQSHANEFIHNLKNTPNLPPFPLPLLSACFFVICFAEPLQPTLDDSAFKYFTTCIVGFDPETIQNTPLYQWLARNQFTLQLSTSSNNAQNSIDNNNASSFDSQEDSVHNLMADLTTDPDRKPDERNNQGGSESMGVPALTPEHDVGTASDGTEQIGIEELKIEDQQAVTDEFLASVFDQNGAFIV